VHHSKSRNIMRKFGRCCKFAVGIWDISQVGRQRTHCLYRGQLVAGPIFWAPKDEDRDVMVVFLGAESAI